MKTLIRAAVLALVASPAFAQDTAELAKKYVELPEVRQMTDEMFAADTMAAQFKATLPPSVQLTDDQIARVGTLMSGEMATLRPKMEQLMITASSELFTAAELNALIDFYTSEHGAAIMKKMQPFMARVLNELGPDMAQLQQNIAPELIKIMQESADQ